MTPRQASWAALSGLLLALAFPPFALWPLAWVALIPLLHAALEAPDAKAAANIAAVAGLVFYGTSLHWLLKVFGKTTPAFWCIYCLWLCLAVVLVWQLWHKPPAILPLRWRAWAWVVMSAAVWVGCEFFRCEVWWLNNAWLALGFSQTVNLPILQSASLWGVYGLSGFIAAFNCAGWLAWRGERKPLAVLATVLATLWLWGRYHMTHHALGLGEPIPVALVQDETGNLDKVFHLSLDGAARNARILVWPEESFTVPAGQEDQFRGSLNARLRGTKAVAVLPGAEYPAASGNGTVQNFTWVLAPDGNLLGRYDKHHPIPFVEDGLLAGPTPRAIDSPVGKLGIQICYDLDFEDGTRHLAHDGAQLLVVPDQDPLEWTDWQHQQHSAMAPMRAVESGLWIARAASSGQSQIIDPVGRIRAQMGTGLSGTLLGTVRLARSGTVYSQMGWLLAPLCLGFSVILTGFYLGAALMGWRTSKRAIAAR